MRLFLKQVLAGLALLLASMPAVQADETKPSFNNYLLKSVNKIYNERKRGGYSLGAAYSQDLAYGPGIVLASPDRGADPPQERRRTMCVAAMAEIIVEAINLYAQETGDETVYDALPASTWNRSNLQSLKPYLFMQQDERGAFGYRIGDVPSAKIKNKNNPDKMDTVYALSRGSGHALSLFGVGEELPFSKLTPGDFINFNRTKTGHAAMFVSYIDKDNRYTTTYSDSVIGFKYFSAQGKGKPDAGFEYRDAYFGAGRSPTAGAIVADTGVRKSPNLLILNGGRMWAPSHWAVASALADIRRKVSDRSGRPQNTRAAYVEQLFVLDMPDSFVDFSDEEE